MLWLLQLLWCRAGSKVFSRFGGHSFHQSMSITTNNRKPKYLRCRVSITCCKSDQSKVVPGIDRDIDVEVGLPD
jgi:hypothetical protein